MSIFLHKTEKFYLILKKVYKSIFDYATSAKTTQGEDPNELKNARNSKCIYISKTWAGRKNKTEKNIHINDISSRMIFTCH